MPGRPTIWMIVGPGPTALAVGAGGGCMDIFTLIYPFSPLSPSLWEVARYRLKFCFNGPLNPNNQPTNPIGKPDMIHRQTSYDFVVLLKDTGVIRSLSIVCDQREAEKQT